MTVVGGGLSRLSPTGKLGLLRGLARRPLRVPRIGNGDISPTQYYDDLASASAMSSGDGPAIFLTASQSALSIASCSPRGAPSNAPHSFRTMSTRTQKENSSGSSTDWGGGF